MRSIRTARAFLAALAMIPFAGAAGRAQSPAEPSWDVGVVLGWEDVRGAYRQTLRAGGEFGLLVQRPLANGRFAFRGDASYHLFMEKRGACNEVGCAEWMSASHLCTVTA